MTTRRVLSWRWSIAPFLILLILAPGGAAVANEAVVRQEFDTAVECLQTGDYKGCETALNKVLELRLSGKRR